MKKLICLLFISISMSICVVHAQKSSAYSMQDAQSRLLDVQTNAYVKPLIVELQINEQVGKIKDEWYYSKEKAEVSLGGDLVNIRKHALYLSSEKYNADVIIAALFNVESTIDESGKLAYKVTVTGFPANFINWKTADNSDLEWIKTEKLITTSEREKISAIVK